MEKEFRSQLQTLRDKNLLLQHTECSKEESEELLARQKNNEALPDDVISNGASTWDEIAPVYMRLSDNPNISYNERIEYLLLQQTEQLKSIKKYMLFFVVLTCISLFLSLISIFGMLS